MRLLRGLRRAANLSTGDGDGGEGAQRAQQLLRSVPGAAHPMPGSSLKPHRWVSGHHFESHWCIVTRLPCTVQE